jgi:lipopolysaccharide biosynthesis protein
MVMHAPLPPKAKTAPTRWWHRAVYIPLETLRHGILARIEALPAPEQFIWRNRAFTYLPQLFAATPAFESWKKAREYFVTHRPDDHHLIDLTKVSSTTNQASVRKPRIAVHAHIYYADMASTLAQYFSHFPQEIDLFISTPFEQDQTLIDDTFSTIKTIANLQVKIVSNRGRDIAPMIDPFGQALLQYDYVAHIHTKKSLKSNQIGDAWCQYLWHQLLSNDAQRLQKIWGLLETHSLIYPQKFPLIDVANLRWGDHLKASHALSQRLGITLPNASLSTEDYAEFPVGSMFWARADALAPLLSSTLTASDFDDETGQTDGALQHTIERNLAYMALSQGLPIAVLRNSAFEHTYP